MINFTPIAKAILGSAAHRSLQAASHPEKEQLDVLHWLLSQGARTAWGREHGIRPGMGYAEFASTVPVSGYEPFRPYVMRMVQGEKDVLWPGGCARFAQSSGTSGGKSKYIPVTPTSLRVNHYAGASRAVGMYINAYPDSRIFSGKGFILGGSFANELSLPAGVKVGDLSANLIDAAGPVVDAFRVPRKSVGLMADWTQKLPALIQASIHQDITNISGVPSWFLTVLKGVIEAAGAQTIEQVWPHLEVFFHGGIAFGPYRSEYAQIAPTLRYWENYNASEGYFACSYAPGEPGMALLQDVGVFYEFAAPDLDPSAEPFPATVPAWRVEPGRTYSLIITSCNGLWRYAIGDTVTVRSLSPLAITIAGRTKSYINAFGEELMVHNAEAAIEKACRALDCSIANYTAAPVYTHGRQKGRHQWLIEWLTPPASLPDFERELDLALQAENSDYQAKRQGGIFLDQLSATSAPAGLFDRWLASTGKLGGQRKVPRLCNDRSVIDPLLAMMQTPDNQ